MHACADCPVTGGMEVTTAESHLLAGSIASTVTSTLTLIELLVQYYQY